MMPYLKSSLPKSWLIVVLLLGSLAVTGCSQKQLKAFAQDVTHNVGCDQRYEHQHKREQYRDDCLRERP